MTVPEIAVSMDAQEFQILQDVAAHLAAEQVGLLHCFHVHRIFLIRPIRDLPLDAANSQMTRIAWHWTLAGNMSVQGISGLEANTAMQQSAL